MASFGRNLELLTLWAIGVISPHYFPQWFTQ